MRVTRHRYAVEGWGVGELIVSGGLVLAHELPDPGLAWDRDRGAGTARSRQSGSPASPDAAGPPLPEGDASPPEVTLAGPRWHVCANSEPNLIAEASLVRRVAARVRAHLRGARTVYDDVQLDLSWCTEFQHELALALRAVPWGEVVSYGELAALAGRPGAARAAGTFCAQNRFALMLPCHRVISSDGIGAYGNAGVGLKRRLLTLEGVEL